MHKNSTLASRRVEQKEEIERKMDKYGLPSIPPSLTRCMWPCLWESGSREVQGSAMQGQTHLCRGLQASKQHWRYQSCSRNADVAWYFASRHYKNVCVFCIATPRQMSSMGWKRLQLFLYFLSLLNKTINSG